MVKSINKLFLFLPSLLLGVCLNTSCFAKDSLLFLNWGEYISDDLVSYFEEKYNVNVIVDIADSNELFYAKLKSGTTKYDLCCPSDYMIQKMYLDNLIQSIDFGALNNYKENIFMDEVYNILDKVDEEMSSFNSDYVKGTINKYHIPYFWGTFGLMYNKNNSFLGTDENQNYQPDVFEHTTFDAWDIYFNDDKVPSEFKMPSSLRKGMYNVVRFSYAASMLYALNDPNAPINKENLDLFKQTISRVKYDMWGGDTLKSEIVGNELGNKLDLAFNYTGDCLDRVYSSIKEGANFEDLNFYTFTPKNTIAHVDSLVVPTGARHYDLALKFIDFILDPVSQYMNSRIVGYCPPLQKTFDMIVNKTLPDKEMYPYAYNDSISEDEHWLTNWSKAMKTTYPLDENKKSINHGTPLCYFDSNQLKSLSNIVNNVKVSN